MSAPRSEQAVIDLVWDLSRAATRRGFEIVEVGPHAPTPILAFRRGTRSEAGRPALYVSSGIHGDEPAGPIAILRLLESDRFPRNRPIDLVPLLNPQGLRDGTRTNALGVDLNRDYREGLSHEVRCHLEWLKVASPRYGLTLCLHEDWEAKGCYAYELVRAPATSCVDTILGAVGEHFPLDPSTEIDGHPASGGRILLPAEPDLDAREDWPEAFRLWRDHGDHHVTFETPSRAWELDRRVEAHMRAVLEALRHL